MSFEIIIHLQNELDKNLKELKKPNESLFYGLTAENVHNIVGWVGIIPILNSIAIGDEHAPVGKTASISDANYAIKLACKYVKKIRSTKILKDIEEVFAILEEFLLDLFDKEYKKEEPGWFGSSRDNIEKYNYGEKIFNKIKYSKNSTINKIYLLHNICKNYGTFPFANLARMAFVAVEFLTSFVDLKIITVNEKKIFLETIQSISFEMSKDLLKSKSKFSERFPV